MQDEIRDRRMQAINDRLMEAFRTGLIDENFTRFWLFDNESFGKDMRAYFRMEDERLKAKVRENEQRMLDIQKKWNKKFNKTRKLMTRQAFPAPSKRF